MDRNQRSNQGGFALVLTILVVVIVGSIVAGAAFIGSNHMIINSYYDRQSEMEMVANAGLEWTRSKLNGDDTFYPDSGYATIENGAAVTDAAGNTLPGVKRWLYVGPSGVTSGQYGVFGTAIAVVRDDGGGEVIRRSEIFQESFAKYAYFTDVEPSNISFGGGDQIFGPVHSNSPIKIYSSGATFHGLVRTASNVPSPQYGTFKQGYQEYVSPIAMPSTADLNKLAAQAAAGNTSFTGNSNGGYGQATTRIEFIAIDLNGDGDESDANEGFIRVYQSADAQWVTGDVSGTTTCTGSGWSQVCTTTGGATSSYQCGTYVGGVFTSTASVGNTTTGRTMLQGANGRCFLGGSDETNSGTFVASDVAPRPVGGWLTFPGTKSALLNGRADKDYLFPINRPLNPNFKGVIYVQGKVVVSGKIRGRVTVAATDDIIFGDDITYVTDPGAGTCVDMAGFFAGDEVIVADNAMNAPQYLGSNHYTLDDTSDEFFHGVVLALDIFTVHNYSSGSTNDEYCESNQGGRGCLYLTGGIIQNTRGAVGTTSGTGYVKRYSYDQCGATQPPPYFPTTGYFAKGQYYHVDPSNFSPSAYYSMITPS